MTLRLELMHMFINYINAHVRRSHSHENPQQVRVTLKDLS